MSFFRGCAVAVLAVGLAGIGCAKVESFGAPPPCSGSHCATNPAGGATQGPDGGGTGGTGGAAAGATDVTGTVHLITNPAFDDLGTQFSGASNVLALPAGTATITTPYGGLTVPPTSFTLLNVPAGLTWFFVQDTSNGGSGALSTLSQAQVPALTAVPLPVIELGVMTSIANSLPSLAANGVSTLGSQIILVLTHLNNPYKGVAVSGGAGGAKIVYDLGPGTYTDTGTATGAAGTVILFNASLSGLAVVTLTDTLATPMTQYQVAVQTALGAATLVRMDLE
jgi:hypothetical protein